MILSKIFLVSIRKNPIVPNWNGTDTQKAEQNIPQGFYVWLGDRLIGEALPKETISTDGDGIHATGYHLGNSPEVRLQYLRVSPGCYAPPAN